MRAAQIVQLHAHNGRMLTRPEILIEQFHEMRNAEQKKIVDEKMSEKMMMSRISSKLISMPSIRRDHGDSANSQESTTETSNNKKDESKNDDDGSQDDIDEDDYIERDDESVEELNISRQKISGKKENTQISSTSDNDLQQDESLVPDIADNDVEATAKESDSLIDGETVVGTSTRIKKRQKLSEVITSATEQDLTAPFSPSGLLMDSDWNPMKDAVMKDFELKKFSYDTNNTLAIRLTVPPGSVRWSFNICPPDHFQSTNILLHFNPRKGKRTELVMNDKQGTWGIPLKKSLSSLNHSNGDSGLSGNSIELIVHIKKEGFIIYVNSHFCTFFAHRRDPEFYSSLRFTLPARDDNGNPEEAVYHKVWWGITDPTLPTHEIPASVLALASMEININPAGLRTVLVTGLPLLFDLKALQVLESALLSLFEEYSPEAVNIVPGESGSAYVKLAEASYVDDFIEVFNGSTVGEDGSKQYTLELSRYDSKKAD